MNARWVERSFGPDAPCYELVLFPGPPRAELVVFASWEVWTWRIFVGPDVVAEGKEPTKGRAAAKALLAFQQWLLRMLDDSIRAPEIEGGE